MTSSCLASCWKSSGSYQGQWGNMMMREYERDSREKKEKKQSQKVDMLYKDDNIASALRLQTARRRLARPASAVAAREFADRCGGPHNAACFCGRRGSPRSAAYLASHDQENTDATRSSQPSDGAHPSALTTHRNGFPEASRPSASSAGADRSRWKRRC
jgi:hypothetical protein